MGVSFFRELAPQDFATVDRSFLAMCARGGWQGEGRGVGDREPVTSPSIPFTLSSGIGQFGQAMTVTVLGFGVGAHASKDGELGSPKIIIMHVLT